MPINVNPSTSGVSQSSRRYLYQDFTRVTGVASASEQLVRQVLIPAGSFPIGGRLRVQYMLTKSGATDAVTSVRLRFGVAGTAADVSIYNVTTIVAGNRAYAASTDLSVNSATVLRQANSNIAQGFEVGGASNAAQPVDFTIGAHTTTPIYVSIFCTMAGTTDTPSVDNLSIELT